MGERRQESEAWRRFGGASGSGNGGFADFSGIDRVHLRAEQS